MNSSPTAAPSVGTAGRRCPRGWAEASPIALPADDEVAVGVGGDDERHWVPAAVVLTSCSGRPGLGAGAASEAAARRRSPPSFGRVWRTPIQVTTHPPPEAAADGQSWLPTRRSFTRTSPPWRLALGGVLLGVDAAPAAVLEGALPRRRGSCRGRASATDGDVLVVGGVGVDPERRGLGTPARVEPADVDPVAAAVLAAARAGDDEVTVASIATLGHVWSPGTMVLTRNSSPCAARAGGAAVGGRRA